MINVLLIFCAGFTLLASSDFCHLIIFANNLDPDQDQCSVGPDLDSNCFDTDSVPEFFEKVNLKKKVS